MVLCKYQTLSQAEKLKKLYKLNFIDLMLYLTLEVTCIIGIVDFLVQPEASGIGKSILMSIMILFNVAFIILWTTVTVWMLVSYTSQSPKLAILLLVCSCGCISPK